MVFTFYFKCYFAVVYYGSVLVFDNCGNIDSIMLWQLIEENGNIGIEEERRLAYVAFTRAEDGLFLSDAEGRTFDGNFRYPSRFLFDIDKVYIKYENIIEDDLLTTAERYIDVSNKIINSSKEKTDILSIDSRISHKKFGLGTIVAINENGEYYTIQFDNLPSTRNIKFGFVERV